MVSETLMGTIARTLRNTPDRLLHARRRREARGRLAGRRPASVLVICHGNICRSPFAAALLARELAPHGIPVTSAGFVGAGRRGPRGAGGEGAALDIGVCWHSSPCVHAG